MKGINSPISAARWLQARELFYFSPAALADWLSLERSQVYRLVARMRAEGLVTEVEKGKYLLLGLEPGRGAAGGASGNTWWLLGAMLISGLGTGIAAPASNNACIELMPERVSTITAIRAMFRQAGGAVSVTAGSLLLHVAGNIASGFVYLYLGISVIMVMMIPALFLMPRSPVVRPKPAKEQGTAGAQSGA